MSFLAGLVLCFGSLGADPVTHEDLQIAVAALEERLTSYAALSVSYRIRSEWTEFGKKPNRPPPPSFLATWNRGVGKESFLLCYEHDSKFIAKKWFFDGKTTHDWQYERNSEQVLRVAITPSAPPLTTRFGNTLAFILGWETYQDVPGGLFYFLQTAQRNDSLAARRIPDGLEIDLGIHKVKSFDFQVVTIVDPAHDHRLESWVVRQVIPGKPSEERFRFVVDEYQAVRDGQTGSDVWFPLRAHERNLGKVDRIEVTDIRINQPIPDSVFVSPAPALGTPLQEAATIPGGASRDSLYGGEAARQQRLDDLAKQARIEMDRLDREGVSHDATPPQMLTGAYAWALGGMILFVALVCRLVRHRRK